MAVMERGIPRFLVALGCFLAGWGVLFAIQGGAIAMVALPDTYSWGDALEEVLVGFLPGLLFGLVAAGLLILMDACLADRLPLNQLLPVGVLAGACACCLMCWAAQASCGKSRPTHSCVGGSSMNTGNVRSIRSAAALLRFFATWSRRWVSACPVQLAEGE